MRKLFFALAILLPLYLTAQTTVTVVTSDGAANQTVVQSSGEIFFGLDYMAILPSADASSMVTYQMDDVSRVLFEGNVNIVNLDGATPLSLSPNPTAGWFTLRGLGSEPQTVTVYSLDGARMMQGRYADGERIDASALTAGIYLVQAGSSVVKLIKR
jgi:hypothetical protein